MSLFESSTQKRFWLFTEEELEQKRQGAQEKSLQRLQESNPGAVMLSKDDERLLRYYYEYKTVKIVKSMRLPTKSAATALTYFKRYCLMRSLMEMNPNVAVLSAIYAAFKVEETIVDADKLCEYVNDMYKVEKPISANTVLNVELMFFQSLQFQLVCFHPYRSLDAIVDALVKMKFDEDEVYAVANEAKKVLTWKALFTDAMFLHPPAQIALGALKYASSRLEKSLDLEMFLSKLIEKEAADGSKHTKLSQEVDDVVRRIKAVSKLAKAADDLERVMELEQIRQSCSNPLNDPESEEYKHVEEESMRRREKHQAKKARRQEKAARREREALTGVRQGHDSDEDDDEDVDEENTDTGNSSGNREQRMNAA
mmetsp:Transcript_8010/g.24115  ORF Transcript_8010/g.24115 Transcript_8010/m.24115 type:complete len:369 (-) Transcript_8010:107-1213(-)